MSKKIFREERLQLIYKRIKETKKVFTKELAEDFNVSRSSIRLDLAELEARGLITRTYGGAILPNGLKGNVVENLSDLEIRLRRNKKEKEAIGKLAATLVEDGDTIMIDGGSTTHQVVMNLQEKRDLTIITNAVSFLAELMAMNASVVYFVGGMLQRDNAVLVGDISNEVVEYFHPMKAILGIDGISIESGLTAANPSTPAVSSIKRKMIAASDKIIIVTDHTKLGRVCLMPVAPINKMDYLITDNQADTDMIERIRAEGPKVLIAET